MVSNTKVTIEGSKDDHLMFNAKINGESVLTSTKQLVEKYNSTELLNWYNETPLLTACYMGEWETVEYLLSCRANVNAQNILGYSPLHAAAQEQHTEIVILLLSNGAIVDLLDNRMNTPLLKAVFNAKNDSVNRLISVLLSYGADRNKKNELGESAWDLAGRTHAYNCIEAFEIFDNRSKLTP